VSTQPSRFRTIVHALSAGTPVLTAIDALAERLGFGLGEVVLQGALKDARVTMPGLSNPLDLPGESAVVYARGLIDPQLGVRSLSVMLAFADRGLPQLIGGTLVEGTVLTLDATLTAFDEGAFAFDDAPQRLSAHSAAPARAPASAATRPAQSALPGVAPTSRPAPAVAPGPAAISAPQAASHPPQSTGWASAVAASNAPRAAPPAAGGRPAKAQVDDESEDLRPGDLIIHPALGRCKVMAAPDADKLRVRLPAGKLTELHMRVVKVTRSADEDGIRVFRATIGAQR